MSTIKDEEALYQNLKNLLVTYIYIFFFFEMNDTANVVHFLMCFSSSFVFIVMRERSELTAKSFRLQPVFIQKTFEVNKQQLFSGEKMRNSGNCIYGDTHSFFGEEL